MSEAPKKLSLGTGDLAAIAAKSLTLNTDSRCVVSLEQYTIDTDQRPPVVNDAGCVDWELTSINIAQLEDQLTTQKRELLKQLDVINQQIGHVQQIRDNYEAAVKAGPAAAATPV